MKKTFLAIGTSALFATVLFGSGLDISQAKTQWTAYKTAEKTAVTGTFADIKYKFGSNTNDITKALEGATATIKPMSADLKDETKNANIRDYFFAKFAKKNLIKVTFKNVMIANDKGSILASVNMNGKTVKVPMQVEIKDKKLEAKGVIDILAFGAKDAFESLATQCHDLHSGVTWSQVEIDFSVPIK